MMDLNLAVIAECFGAANPSEPSQPEPGSQTAAAATATAPASQQPSDPAAEPLASQGASITEPGPKESGVVP